MSTCLTDIELAHSKPTCQSSTYDNHAASMAVDGDPATFSKAAVESNDRSDGSVIGWWQVDLGDTYEITSMTIVNSIEFYGDVLDFFELRNMIIWSKLHVLRPNIEFHYYIEIGW